MNCVVLVKCVMGGWRAKPKEAEKSAMDEGGPGFGSLKLVKTACGVPGDELFPPN